MKVMFVKLFVFLQCLVLISSRNCYKKWYNMIDYALLLIQGVDVEIKTS